MGAKCTTWVIDFMWLLVHLSYTIVGQLNELLLFLAVYYVLIAFGLVKPF